MDWRSPRNKWWIRLIAIILTVCFIHQDIVWAQEGLPVWSKGQNGSFNLGEVPGNDRLNPDIVLPADIAVTKGTYSGKSGDNKIIINIQDAHASLSAQESISSILDSLVTNYDLKLVAIEGSSGYIDTSVLKTFPDEKIRKSTAQYLMAKGKISAGEFYSVTGNKSIALYGIENKTLYRENAEQFRKVCEINQAVSKDISNLLKILKRIDDRISSPELKALESNSVLKNNGSVSFTNRWAYISSLASSLRGCEAAEAISKDKIASSERLEQYPPRNDSSISSIDIKAYPNLSKLEESIKLEKQISFDKANKERDALIDILSKTATKADLEQLVLRSLSFKQGKISQGGYYLFLHGLAQNYAINPTPYKNLINFTEYITLYESINLLEIFEEAKLLEDAIREKLYTTPGQKKLHDILKCVNYIKDIFELKLTNSDFAELEKSLEKINAETIREFTGEPCGLDNIFSNIPAAVAFYKTAEKRNNVILENTITRMNKEGQSVAALITGGYHTKGISEILKAKQASYIVLLPKFDASKGERPYVAILTNKKEIYGEQLESGKYQLLTEEYFKDSIQAPGMVESFIKDIVVTSLKKAMSEGKNVHNIAKLWIESYASNYEELKAKGIIKADQAEVARSSRGRLNVPYNADKSGSGSRSVTGDRHIATTAGFPQGGVISPAAFAGIVNGEAGNIEEAEPAAASAEARPDPTRIKATERQLRAEIEKYEKLSNRLSDACHRMELEIEALSGDIQTGEMAMRAIGLGKELKSYQKRIGEYESAISRLNQDLMRMETERRASESGMIRFKNALKSFIRTRLFRLIIFAVVSSEAVVVYPIIAAAQTIAAANKAQAEQLKHYITLLDKTLRLLIHTESGLPVDKGRIFKDLRGEWQIAQTDTKVTPANLGVAAASFLALLDIEPNADKKDEITKILLKAIKASDALEKHNSGLLFASYEYDLSKRSHVPVKRSVPAFDNAILTIALKMVCEKYKFDATAEGKELVRIARKMIDVQGYHVLESDGDKSAIVGELDADGIKAKWYANGKFGSEFRALAIVLAAMGKIDESCVSKAQITIGKYKLLSGEEIPVLMTHDGAGFQMLMPNLFINEASNPILKVFLNNYIRVVEDQGERRKIFGDTVNFPAAHSASEVNKGPGTAYDGSQGNVALRDPANMNPVGAEQENYITPHLIALMGTIAGFDHSWRHLSALKNISPESFSAEYGFCDAVGLDGKSVQVKLTLDESMFTMAFAMMLNPPGVSGLLINSDIGGNINRILDEQAQRVKNTPVTWIIPEIMRPLKAPGAAGKGRTKEEVQDSFITVSGNLARPGPQGLEYYFDQVIDADSKAYLEGQLYERSGFKDAMAWDIALDPLSWDGIASPDGTITGPEMLISLIKVIKDLNVIAGDLKRAGFKDTKEENEVKGTIVAISREIVKNPVVWKKFIDIIRDAKDRVIGVSVKRDKVAELCEAIKNMKGSDVISRCLEIAGFTTREDKNGAIVSMAREVVTDYDVWKDFFGKDGKIATKKQESNITLLFMVFKNLGALDGYLIRIFTEKQLSGVKMAIAREIVLTDVWKHFLDKSGRVVDIKAVEDFFTALSNMKNSPLLNECLELAGYLAPEDKDGTLVSIARELAQPSKALRWAAFLNKNGSVADPARVKELFSVLGNLKAIDVYLKAAGFGKRAVVEGIKMSIAWDIVLHYDAWKQFFKKNGLPKDVKRIASLLNALKDPAIIKDAESLLAAITLGGQQKLDLGSEDRDGDPDDIGFLVSWVRTRLSRHSDLTYTSDLTERYITIIKSSQFSEYLAMLGLAVNFRSELAAAFLGKTEEAKEIYYDLIGVVSFFAKWGSPDEINEEIAYQLKVKKDFKTYFKNNPSDAVRFNKLMAAHSKVLLEYHLLLRESEVNRQGGKWSDLLRKKEESKFDAIFFQSTLMALDKFCRRHDITMDVLMKDFLAIYEALQNYPMDMAMSGPLTEQAVKELQEELAKGDVLAGEKQLSRILFEKGRFTMAIVWLDRYYDENNGLTMDRALKNIAWETKIWEGYRKIGSGLIYALTSADVSALTKIYDWKSEKIESEYFERASRLQNMAKNTIGRTLYPGEMLSRLTMYELNMLQPLRSQGGMYSGIADRIQQRTFADVIPSDMDKAHLGRLDDESVRAKLWQGGQQMGKNLADDAEAKNFIMSILPELSVLLSNGAAEKTQHALEHLSNLFNTGRTVVLRYRSSIFNPRVIAKQKDLSEAEVEAFFTRRLMTRPSEIELSDAEKAMTSEKFIESLVRKIRVKYSMTDWLSQPEGLKSIGKIWQSFIEKVSQDLGKGMITRQEAKAILTDFAVLYSEGRKYLRDAIRSDTAADFLYRDLRKYRIVRYNVARMRHIENCLLEHILKDIQNCGIAGMTSEEEDQSTATAELVHTWVEKFGLEAIIDSDLNRRIVAAMDQNKVSPATVKKVLSDLSVAAAANRVNIGRYTDGIWVLFDTENPAAVKNTVRSLIRMISEARGLGLEESGIIDIEKKDLTKSEELIIADFEESVDYECREAAERQMKIENLTKRGVSDPIGFIEQDKTTGNINEGYDSFNSILGWSAFSIAAVIIWAYICGWSLNKSQRKVAPRIKKDGTIEKDEGGEAPAGLSASFGAYLDPELQNISGYHSLDAFCVNTNSGDITCGRNDAGGIDGIITAIAADGTTALQVDVPDIARSIKLNVDNRLMELCKERGIGGDKLTQALRNAVELRIIREVELRLKGEPAGDRLKQFDYIADRPISIVLLDKSGSIFEDHIQNGFIGVNRVLFEVMAKEEDLSAEELLVQIAVGVSHELRHEAGTGNTREDEEQLTGEDVAVTLELSKKMGVYLHRITDSMEWAAGREGYYSALMKHIPAKKHAARPAPAGLPASLVFYLYLLLTQMIALGVIYVSLFDWANGNPMAIIAITMMYIWLNVGNAIVLTDRLVTAKRYSNALLVGAEVLSLSVIYKGICMLVPMNPYTITMLLLSFTALNAFNVMALRSKLFKSGRMKDSLKWLFRIEDRTRRHMDYRKGLPAHRRTGIAITTLATGDNFTITLENLVQRTLLKNRDKNITAIIYDASLIVDERAKEQLDDQEARVEQVRLKYGLDETQLIYIHRGLPAMLKEDIPQKDLVNTNKKFGGLEDLIVPLGAGELYARTEHEIYTGRTQFRSVFLVGGLIGAAFDAVLLVFGVDAWPAFSWALGVSSLIGFAGVMLTSGATTRKGKIKGEVRYLQEAKRNEPRFDRTNGNLRAIGLSAGNLAELISKAKSGENIMLPPGKGRLWGLFLLDDKNFAGDTVAESVQSKVKTLLILSGRANPAGDLEAEAERIVTAMERNELIVLGRDVTSPAAREKAQELSVGMGIAGVNPVTTSFEILDTFDEYNRRHLTDMQDYLVKTEGFDAGMVGDLAEFLEDYYHYQPIRKAAEVMAHPDQEFAAMGNVWIDGPNLEFGKNTQSGWEYLMWICAKSGQFFERSMQLFTLWASFYGKGFVVIDRWLNPRQIEKDLAPGWFLMGAVGGAFLGLSVGLIFDGWGIGAFAGLATGSLFGGFESRYFLRAIIHFLELSHDYSEADLTGGIHTVRAGIYEPGSRNYLAHNDERSLFRWFLGVLVYVRRTFGPGVHMSDRWINFLAIRMYANEIIFYTWCFTTLLVAPTISGTVNSLLFGPRFIEFCSPLIMFAMFTLMLFQIIFIPNLFIKDEGSLITRGQMMSKVVSTTAVFLNNMVEGTWRLFTNLPRVFVGGTHPEYTRMEIPLSARALFLIPLGLGIAFLSIVCIFPSYITLSALSIAGIMAFFFVVSYACARTSGWYVPVGWVVAGMAAGALLIALPAVIGADISTAMLGDEFKSFISGVLRTVMPRLASDHIGYAVSDVAAYIENIGKLPYLGPAFLLITYPLKLVFAFLASHEVIAMSAIKVLAVLTIFKWLAKLLQLMKEPMPWTGTLAKRGETNVLTLYKTAKKLKYSFIVACVTTGSGIFITSNIWQLAFAFPVMYSLTHGFMHVWYMAKPMWYEGAPNRVDPDYKKSEKGQYTVRQGVAGFWRKNMYSHDRHGEEINGRGFMRAIKSDWAAHLDAFTQAIATRKKENKAPYLLIAGLFMDFLANAAFTIGILVGVPVMFGLSVCSGWFVINALPALANETAVKMALMIIEHVFGTVTGLLIVPPMMGYMLAFLPMVLGWIFDSVLTVKNTIFVNPMDKDRPPILREEFKLARDLVTGKIFRPAVPSGAPSPEVTAEDEIQAAINAISGVRIPEDKSRKTDPKKTVVRVLGELKRRASSKTAEEINADAIKLYPVVTEYLESVDPKGAFKNNILARINVMQKHLDVIGYRPPVIAGRPAVFQGEVADKQSEFYDAKLRSGDRTFNRTRKGVEELKARLEKERRISGDRKISVSLPGAGERVFMIDVELERALTHYGIDMQRLIGSDIPEAIKIRGPSGFTDIPKTPITFALLDASRSIFEDHRKNNLIATNSILFSAIEEMIKLDGMSGETASKLLNILVVVGYTHELKHESGAGDSAREETALTEEDIVLTMYLACRAGLKFHQVTSVLKDVLRGKYPAVLQRPDGTIRKFFYRSLLEAGEILTTKDAGRRLAEEFGDAAVFDISTIRKDLNSLLGNRVTKVRKGRSYYYSLLPKNKVEENVLPKKTLTFNMTREAVEYCAKRKIYLGRVVKSASRAVGPDILNIRGPLTIMLADRPQNRSLCLLNRTGNIIAINKPVFDEIADKYPVELAPDLVRAIAYMLGLFIGQAEPDIKERDARLAAKFMPARPAPAQRKAIVPLSPVQKLGRQMYRVILRLQNSVGAIKDLPPDQRDAVLFKLEKLIYGIKSGSIKINNIASSFKTAMEKSGARITHPGLVEQIVSTNHNINSLIIQFNSQQAAPGVSKPAPRPVTPTQRLGRQMYDVILRSRALLADMDTVPTGERRALLAASAKLIKGIRSKSIVIKAIPQAYFEAMGTLGIRITDPELKKLAKSVNSRLNDLVRQFNSSQEDSNVLSSGATITMSADDTLLVRKRAKLERMTELGGAIMAAGDSKLFLQLIDSIMKEKNVGFSAAITLALGQVRDSLDKLAQAKEKPTAREQEKIDVLASLYELLTAVNGDKLMQELIDKIVAAKEVRASSAIGMAFKEIEKQLAAQAVFVPEAGSVDQMIRLACFQELMKQGEYRDDNYFVAAATLADGRKIYGRFEKARAEGILDLKAFLHDNKEVRRSIFIISGKKVEIEIDGEIASLCAGRGIDIEKLIRAAVAGRECLGPFEGMQDGAVITMALLEKSAAPFENHRQFIEDHIQNGFIGINRGLFDIENDAHLEAALAIGITHELRHESGISDENVITEEDVRMTIGLAGTAAEGAGVIKGYINGLEAVTEGRGPYLLAVMNAVNSHWPAVSPDAAPAQNVEPASEEQPVENEVLRDILGGLGVSAPAEEPAWEDIIENAAEGGEEPASVRAGEPSVSAAGKTAGFVRRKAVFYIGFLGAACAAAILFLSLRNMRSGAPDAQGTKEEEAEGEPSPKPSVKPPVPPKEEAVKPPVVPEEKPARAALPPIEEPAAINPEEQEAQEAVRIVRISPSQEPILQAAAGPGPERITHRAVELSGMDQMPKKGQKIVKNINHGELQFVRKITNILGFMDLPKDGWLDSGLTPKNRTEQLIFEGKLYSIEDWWGFFDRLMKMRGLTTPAQRRAFLDDMAVHVESAVKIHREYTMNQRKARAAGKLGIPEETYPASFASRLMGNVSAVLNDRSWHELERGKGERDLMRLETVLGLAYEQYVINEFKVWNEAVRNAAQEKFFSEMAKRHGILSNGEIAPNTSWTDKPGTSTYIKGLYVKKAFDFCRSIIDIFRDREIMSDVKFRAEIFGDMGQLADMSDRQSQAIRRSPFYDKFVKEYFGVNQKLPSKNDKRWGKVDLAIKRYIEHLFRLYSMNAYPYTGIQKGSLHVLMHQHFFDMSDARAKGLKEGMELADAVENIGGYLHSVFGNGTTRGDELLKRQSAFRQSFGPSLPYMPLGVPNPYVWVDAYRKFWEAADHIEQLRQDKLNRTKFESVERIKELMRDGRRYKYFDPSQDGVIDMFADSLFESTVLDVFVKEVLAYSDQTGTGRNKGAEYLFVENFMRLLEEDVDKDFRKLYEQEYGDFIRNEGCGYTYADATGKHTEIYRILDDFLAGKGFSINEQGQIDIREGQDFRKAKAMKDILEKNIERYPPIFRLEIGYVLKLINEAERDGAVYPTEILRNANMNYIIQPGILKDDLEREQGNLNGRIRRLYGDLAQLTRRMLLQLYVNDRLARLQAIYERSAREMEKEYNERLAKGAEADIPEIFGRRLGVNLDELIKEYKLMPAIRQSVSMLFYGDKDRLELASDATQKDSARLSTIAHDFVRRGFIRGPGTEDLDTKVVKGIIDTASGLKAIPEFAEYVKLFDTNPRKAVFSSRALNSKGQVAESFWVVRGANEKAEIQLGILLSHAEEMRAKGENLEAFTRRIRAKTEAMNMEFDAKGGGTEKGIDIAMRAVSNNLNAKRKAFGREDLAIEKGASFFELDQLAQGTASAFLNAACERSADIKGVARRQRRTRRDFEDVRKRMEYVTELYRDYNDGKKLYLYKGRHVIDWALANAGIFYGYVYPGFNVLELSSGSAAREGLVDSLLDTMLTFEFNKKEFKYDRGWVRDTVVEGLEKIEGIIEIRNTNPGIRDGLIKQVCDKFYGQDERYLEKFKKFLPYVPEHTTEYFNKWRSFIKGAKKRLTEDNRMGASGMVAAVVAAAGMNAAKREELGVGENRREFLFGLNHFTPPPETRLEAKTAPERAFVPSETGSRFGYVHMLGAAFAASWRVITGRAYAKKILIGTNSLEVYDDLKVKIERKEYLPGIVKGIVFISDAGKLHGLAWQRGLAGVFIDDTVPVKTANEDRFKRDIAAIKITNDYGFIFNTADVDRARREEIIKAVIAIIGKIEDKAPAEIFGMAQAAIANGLTAERKERLAYLETAIPRHFKALSSSAQYNNMNIYKDITQDKNVAHVTTEQVALQDPSFISNVRHTEDQKLNVTNVFVYGEIFKTLEQARTFIKKCGYEGSLDNIKFINKNGKAYEDLFEEIQSVTSIMNPDDIGLRVAPGEFGDINPALGRILEVQEIVLGGKQILVTVNTYQVLLRILKSNGENLDISLALEGKLPGLIYYDSSRGVFKYLPRTLPVNYGLEIEASRNAILLLTSAA